MKQNRIAVEIHQPEKPLGILFYMLGESKVASFYKNNSYDFCYKHMFNNTVPCEKALAYTFEEGNHNEFILEHLNHSISVGDVITYNGEAYLVMPEGFKRIKDIA